MGTGAFQLGGRAVCLYSHLDMSICRRKEKVALRSVSEIGTPVRTLLELTVVPSLPCIHSEHQKVVTGVFHCPLALGQAASKWLS